MDLQQVKDGTAVMSKQVREVFAHNLKKELVSVRKMSGKYRYVTIDVEYPGLVYKSTITRHRLMSPDERYTIIKANVDNLKVVQVGLTLSNLDDADTITWVFNFREFNPMEDLQDPDSVEFLKSKGINLKRNYKQGIHPDRFADFFWESRLPLNYGKMWITFHGSYDMAFLLKIMSRQTLPKQFHQFQYDLTLYFGQNIFDAKHIMKSCNGLYGGLESVAKLLNLQRVAGLPHHAGSDSLLTWAVYKKIMDKYFNHDVKFRHACILCGLQDC